MDYSCTFTIDNRLDVPLECSWNNVVSGEWVTSPSTVSAKSTKEFKVKDKFGSFGSEASMNWQAKRGGKTVNVDIWVRCGSMASNIAKIKPDSDTVIGSTTGFDPEGHPVNVKFILEHRL